MSAPLERPGQSTHPLELALGRFVPALAYAAPVALALIVSAVVGWSVSSARLAIVDGTVVDVVPGEGFTRWVLGLLVVTVAHAFGATAATLAMNADVLGTRAGVAQAWRGAARRWPAVLLAWAVTLLVAVTALAIAVAAGLLLPLGIALLVVAIVVALVLAPLLVGWAVVVQGGARWPAAFGRAWKAARDTLPTSIEVRRPRASLVLTLVLLTALSLAVAWLIDRLAPSPLSAALATAASVLLPGVTALVLLAVAVRAAAVRRLLGTPGVEVEAGADPAAPRPATHPAGGRGGALAGLGVLLVPALVLVPLALLNPWGLPSYSAAPVGMVDDSAWLTQAGDREVLLTTIGSGQGFEIAVCEGSVCGPNRELSAVLGAAIEGTPAGGLISAQWIPREAEGDKPDRFDLDVVASTAAEVAAWQADDGDAEEVPGPFPDGTRTTVTSVDYEREESGALGTSLFLRKNADDTAVAMGWAGENPVIAAIALTDPSSRDAVLTVLFCLDAACTDAEEQMLRLPWYEGAVNPSTLDVAVTPDGSAVVTVAARTGDPDDPLALRVVSTAPASSPTITPIGAPVTTGFDGDDVYDTTFGARIALGADDRPTILSRRAGSSELQLITCRDATCADAEVTVVPSPADVVDAGDLRNPAFVIDDSGRPLLATYDAALSELVLVSCLDEGCSAVERRAVATLVPDASFARTGLALSLSPEDTPILAVSGQRVGAGDTGRDRGTVLHCTAARCGMR